MRRALSFDNSPPLSVPFRFFLNVPVFAALAGLLLLWAGPQALESRWTPSALALTHLMTLGVLASAMVGALIQILPVATGISVLAPRLASTFVHPLLIVGTLFLAAAFLFMRPILFQLALYALLAAFLWLAGATLGGSWRHRAMAQKGSNDVLLSTRLVVGALLATLLSGGLLAVGFAWSLPLPMILLTNIHAAWGLLGWIGLLLMGMAFQLIPIFQATEVYPRAITRWLATLSFVMLILHTSAALLGGNNHLAERILGALLLSLYFVFALQTFYLLWTRKRPKADATTLFWRTAMVCLATCPPVWLAGLATGTEFPVTLGVLFIAGFAWSAVNGMLYKIIPFLLWYHAQKNLVTALRIVPKVKDIIPDARATSQFRLHVLALALLLSASIWPPLFTHAAAIAFTASAATLGWNIAAATRLYWNAQKQIQDAAPSLPISSQP
ncbi:hypothetical protein EKL30_01195 [Candidimonas sp. SYP-B2681]|nr:hypothetical protein EKL30_01195 [Candidimonas sp. SYP-B2681]